MPRRAFGQYPSDVSEEEWAFCAPYLTLMREDAPQREYSLRAVFNALRHLIRAGCPWRMLPNDLPPWSIVHQQTRRWVEAGVFETMAKDLHALLRVVVHARGTTPSAVVLDSRTVQSTPESAERACYDGYKRRKGSKIHIAVDTLGHLLALHVTPAERAGPGSSRGAGSASTETDRGERAHRLCRSRVHRGERSRGGDSARHRPVCSEIGGCETMVRVVAEAMGGGAQHRLGVALSTSRS